ncbi:hypothetical protein COCSUDRAFT_32113 [Coccomyxa subellipsoidea C-169]|uniref:Uncharacterized protein n=1 Tax=Coccomyxa subellipsoidea (strain C-169) TaxID=574566 RepID=I0ZAY6_COCSC|nr:hypothetical protein COCSUDRAFT_32113 [Coccomyxa subellipsoidea C-169]EIE27805.1 hypothetical protein COCSUDRAFT_32113 [Coccomyxa subellipsoidea C-169]|eukprot:XP_005652349.1 hypothetical protein COCSUDRAFT_32113 [Coccomyxa subellipsoidea C-169]
MGACKPTLCVLATALCLSYPVNGMDYITGQSHRRSLQQGPGGITCQGQYQSAQYRCMSLTSRPNNYQFCVRLCDTSLGRNRDTSADSSLVGSGGSGNSTSPTLGGSGGLGGASLGGAGLGSGGGGGAGSCTPCQDTQQQCQQGSSGGGVSQQYYRPYVNRYYTGLGCQDTGPFVRPAGFSASPSSSPSSSPSGSPGSSPRASPSPA